MSRIHAVEDAEPAPFSAPPCGGGPGEGSRAGRSRYSGSKRRTFEVCATPCLTLPRKGEGTSLNYGRTRWRIERVEIRMVDLVPKVKRIDAIQSFVSQETPIVRITDADGAVGTGYSYTIGTGGPSIVELIAPHARAGADRPRGRHGRADLARSPVPHPRDRRSARSPRSRSPRSTPRCGTCAAARPGLPLHVMAGGAQDKVPLYTTEGGWLHLETEALVEDALQAKAHGFGGSQGQGRPARRTRTSPGSRRCARRSAPASRSSPTPTRPSPSTRRSAARGSTRPPTSAGSRSRCRPTTSRAMSRLSRVDHHPDRGRREPLQSVAFPRLSAARRLLDRPGRRRAHRRHHALAEDRASGRDLQRRRLPAFPDGAACRALLRRAERALGRIYPAARRPDDRAAWRSRTATPCPAPQPGLGIAWDFAAIERLTVEGTYRDIGRA